MIYAHFQIAYFLVIAAIGSVFFAILFAELFFGEDAAADRRLRKRLEKTDE